MSDKTCKIYFGWSLPRKGRQVTIQRSMDYDALLAIAYGAFDVSPMEKFTICAADRDEKTVIGSLGDSNLTPYETINTLDGSNLVYELVFIPCDDQRYTFVFERYDFRMFFF